MIHTPEPLPPLPPLPDLSDASCLGSQLFENDKTEHLALLRRVCAACPVRRACLAVALRSHPAFTQGVWAGTTSEERARLRVDLGIRFASWTTPKLMHELTGEPVTRAKRKPATSREIGPTDAELVALEQVLAEHVGAESLAA